jgi:hypothetical protein
MRVVLLSVALAFAASAGVAHAQPGSAKQPIIVHMRRGADVIRVTGRLRQNVDCCAYQFEAHAGQILEWTVSGPVVRMQLTYPDGHFDSGLGDSVPLPQDGAYVLAISGNTNADNAFGRFTLRLRIPPPAK